MFNRYIKAMRYIRKGHRAQEGMTGLETAIILIAFVTVAAVFGYAVLSAGLFSAERGKETVYAGLEQAKSNLEISGSVVARCDNVTDGNVDNITFTLKNSIAGNPIDLTPNDSDNATNRCIISLRTADNFYNNVRFTVNPVGYSNGDNVLSPGEQFEITLNLNDIDGSSTGVTLGANDKFAVQVKPNIGSTSTIERTLPAAIDPVVDLF